MSGMGSLVARYPHVDWRLYVDDLCMQQRGRQRDLVRAVLPPTDAAAEEFRQAGLDFSVGDGGKSVQLASTAWLRRRLRPALRKRGIPVLDSTIYLGVDLPMHAAARRAKRRQRAAQLGERTARLSGLRRAGRRMARGVARVFKTGLKSACVYGSRCLGLPEAQLQALRRAAGRSLSGKVGGQSLTLQLAVAGPREDPTAEVTAAPLVEWAAAVWEERVPSEVLQRAWRRQQQEVGMKRRWAAVRGPAGACIMSLPRAGWCWPRWDTFRSREGLLLDLREVCPQDVKAMVLLDVEAELWARWTAQPGREQLAPMPLIAPLVTTLRRPVTDGWGPHARNAARQAVVHGPWTQSELFAIGRVGTATCQACGAAPGTPHHRYYCCEAKETTRREAPPRWQHVARQQPHSWLWTRGLVRHPGAAWDFQAVGEHIEWSGPAVADLTSEGETRWEDLTFTGVVCCDGSKLGSTQWAQTGWAAMSVSPDGEPLVMARGALPVALPVQRTIKRAELWALLGVLRHVELPCLIYTDHLAIVQGLAQGRRWCCSAARPHADVWRRIWFKIDDLDFPLDAVRHCKAHRSRAQMEALTGSERHAALGNSWVYRAAKEAATGDAGYGRDMAVRQAAEKVQWALGNIGWWHQRVDSWGDVEEQPARRAAARARRQGPTPALVLVAHDIARDRGVMRCRACGRWAKTAGSTRQLLASACHGRPWRPARQAIGDGRDAVITVLGEQVGRVPAHPDPAGEGAAAPADEASLDAEAASAGQPQDDEAAGATEDDEAEAASGRPLPGRQHMCYLPPQGAAARAFEASLDAEAQPELDGMELDFEGDEAVPGQRPVELPAVASGGPTTASSHTAALAAALAATAAAAAVASDDDEMPPVAAAAAGSTAAARDAAGGSAAPPPPKRQRCSAWAARATSAASAAGAAGAAAASASSAGSAASAGRPHSIEEHHGYIVCVVCGAYATRCRRGLAGACPGRREDAAARERRRRANRIRDGLHPTAGRPLP